MEFPFGHHHHRHGHHQPEEDANPNPNLYPDSNPYPNINPYENPAPPPPYYGGAPPPPPHAHHVPHEYGYAPPPPPHAQHVSHEVGGGEYGYENQMPPPPSGHFPHERVGYESRPHGGELPRQPTVRVYTKADENYSLSIRNGSVVLVRSDPGDDYQHWIRDLRYSTRVKDEEGLPSFALVNKVTGQAIKHAVNATHPVQLVPYNPDHLDESVLWTESKDTGEDFRCIRMVNNIRLNFDAFHGDEDHGGVREGTPVVLWEWLKGKNQRWKIVPY